jgi:hypothetical protein
MTRRILARVIGAAVLVAVVPDGAIASAAHPVVGDWEGSNGPVSFIVKRGPVRGRPQSVVLDVVLNAPETCKTRGRPATVTPTRAARVPGRVTVRRSGTVHAVAHDGSSVATLTGRFSSGRSVRLTYRSTDSAPDLVGGGIIRCTSGPIHVVAHPSHRLGVRTGVWRGRAANGMPVTFHVGLGGRILESDPTRQPAGAFTFGHVSCSHDLCVGGACASDLLVDVMIAPDGTFDTGADPGVGGRAIGTFTSRRTARGTWSAGSGGTPGSCDGTWTAAPG